MQASNISNNSAWLACFVISILSGFALTNTEAQDLVPGSAGTQASQSELKSDSQLQSTGQTAEQTRPASYEKVCSLYGAGFYYLRRTDICIKIGGYVRMEVIDPNIVFGRTTKKVEPFLPNSSTNIDGATDYVSNSLGLALANTGALKFRPLTRNQGFKGKVESDSQSESMQFDEKFQAVVDTNKVTKKVHFGPFSLTSSYTNSTRMAGIGPDAEVREDQTIAFDTGVSRWAPSAVYVSTFLKDASYPTLVEGPPDRTTGGSVGATWGWTGGNLNVNYWSYDFNSSRLGSFYNSSGHGFDAVASGGADEFGYYAKLSYHQNNDLSYTAVEYIESPFSTIGRGYDAFLSVSYKPQHLPDISLDGGLGRYTNNNFGVADDGEYWSAALGVDFSKFLFTRASTSSFGGLPTAKLIYRYFYLTDRSFGVSGASQLWGILIRTQLD